MKLRPGTLWRVPVYCTVASLIVWYLTIYLGAHFFVVTAPGADGIPQISLDPLRSDLFDGAMFLIVFLLGGLWAFRSMTRAEIAVSAAILSAIYFVVVLGELYLSSFPPSFSIRFAMFTTWKSFVSSIIFRLIDQPALAALIPQLSPFLFVLFGRRSAETPRKTAAKPEAGPSHEF